MITGTYDSLSDAWINTLALVYRNGVLVPTEYGVNAKCVVGYVAEIHSTAAAHPGDPFCTPRKVAEYKRQLSREMLGKGGFDYTYIDRLAAYNGVDQLKYMREKAGVPCSRRCQGIAWMPEIDTLRDHIPCMQRLWTYTWPDRSIDLHIHYRSHDLFKAYEANLLAIAEMVNTEVAAPNGLKMGAVRLMDDNIHIYEDDFQDVERVLKVYHR